MSTSSTGQTSTSESKTSSEMLSEIQALKAENKMLQSIKSMTSQGREQNAVPEQRLMQAYPHIIEMLSNPGFDEAYRLVVDDIQRQVFNTEPNEPDKREILYFQAQAMQSLLLKLGYMVTLAQNNEPSS